MSVLTQNKTKLSYYKPSCLQEVPQKCPAVPNTCTVGDLLHHTFLLQRGFRLAWSLNGVTIGHDKLLCKLFKLITSFFIGYLE